VRSTLLASLLLFGLPAVTYADEPEETPEEPPVPAGTQDDPLLLDFSEIEVKRDRPPSFSLKKSDPAECIASVLVDPNGIPTLEEVKPAEGAKCPKVVRTPIEEAMGRWRFANPVHPTTGEDSYARVGVPFSHGGASGALLDKEKADVLDALFRSFEVQSDDADTGCVLGLRVFADGAAVDRTTNDPYNCLVLPEGKPPKKLFKAVRKGEVRCTVSADAVGREATNVTSECDAEVDAFLPDLLKGWAFNGTEGGRPYRLALVFTSDDAE
jgi:hypothetical protein